MVDVVGATVLADSVISWAIGDGIEVLANWARLAVHCKSNCAALADLLERQELRDFVHKLDSLTHAAAFAHVRVQYDRLCEQLEEAQYLVLRCQQTKAFSIVMRVRMGKRIEAVHCALEATPKDLEINVSAALKLDQAIKEQQERDEQAAHERARLQWELQGDPPLKDERGKVNRAASLCVPQLPNAIFQHLDDLVPRLCTELPNHRVHGIVGMAGLGKTTVATAVYDRTKDTFKKHFFLTVGERADALLILRSVFKTIHPKKQVRRPALLQWPSCVQLAPAAPASSALQDLRCPCCGCCCGRPAITEHRRSAIAYLGK
jgi:hypothetical protein